MNHFFLQTAQNDLPSDLAPQETEPAGGAHCNGLRDVEEARTSPLLPPESRRLAAPICYILRKHLVHFAESFGLAESFGIAVPY